MHTQLTTSPLAATGVIVRDATPADAESCGQIFYDAFASIATRHRLPIEPSSREYTRVAVTHMLANGGVAGLVAERAGEVVGSAFVDERATIAGIGPVTVDPAAQDDGIGRALMEAALRRERDREAVGIRLVQTAYHYRSMALYTKLGFVVREPLSVLQGTPPALSIPGLGVRPAEERRSEFVRSSCAPASTATTAPASFATRSWPEPPRSWSTPEASAATPPDSATARMPSLKRASTSSLCSALPKHSWASGSSSRRETPDCSTGASPTGSESSSNQRS